MQNLPSYSRLQQVLSRQGYAFFDTGDYNVNLIGIRSAYRRAGRFDDQLCVAFRQAGNPIVFTFKITTDPGIEYLESPLVPAGAAILKPGQYRSMWQIGMHKSAYQALVQRGKCTVYRDKNKDDVLDDGPTEESGYFGINLHYAREAGITPEVGRWSAGCQVMADAEEYHLLMALVNAAALRYGINFTYTLLLDSQL